MSRWSSTAGSAHWVLGNLLRHRYDPAVYGRRLRRYRADQHGCNTGSMATTPATALIFVRDTLTEVAARLGQR